MYHQFKTVLLSFAIVLMALPVALYSAQFSSLPVIERDGGLSGLTVVQTINGFDLSWQWISTENPSSYAVTVTDLNTSTQMFSSSTSSSYLHISGLTLTRGHTYRFAVAANDSVIIVDIAE